jgi:hypothetical protein
LQRSFTILRNRVVIETDEPDLFDRSEDIVVCTEDRLPICGEISLRLETEEGLISVTQNGQTLVQQADPELAIRDMHLLINRLILEPHTEVLKLHTGAATWQKRFFLVTGDRNAGKTTLLLKLMLDGAEMHCDETVLLHDGLIQTFPRKFYVKNGTLQHLPRIREICADKRSYPTVFGPRFYFADPTDLGLHWRSEEARPWAIFHLTPAFDQPPRLDPCAKVDMVKHLLFQTIRLTGDFGFHVKQVCRMVDKCLCFSLQVGELNATADLLKEALVRPAV